MSLSNVTSLPCLNVFAYRSFCYTPPSRLGKLPKIRSAITSGDAAKDERQEEQVC